MSLFLTNFIIELYSLFFTGRTPIILLFNTTISSNSLCFPSSFGVTTLLNFDSNLASTHHISSGVVLIKRSVIRIPAFNNGGCTSDTWFATAGMMETNLVAYLHLIMDHVAGFLVADTVPGGGAVRRLLEITFAGFFGTIGAFGLQFKEPVVTGSSYWGINQKKKKSAKRTNPIEKIPEPRLFLFRLNTLWSN